MLQLFGAPRRAGVHEVGWPCCPPVSPVIHSPATPMSRELKPLREVLQRAVAAARLHVRTVEQALGLPVGGWDELLSGQRVLRVRHLLALARLLRVPPADFLEIGLPEASRAADL